MWSAGTALSVWSTAEGLVLLLSTIACWWLCASQRAMTALDAHGGMFSLPPHHLSWSCTYAHAFLSTWDWHGYIPMIMAHGQLLYLTSHDCTQHRWGMYHFPPPPTDRIVYIYRNFSTNAALTWGMLLMHIFNNFKYKFQNVFWNFMYTIFKAQISQSEMSYTIKI